MFTNDDRAKRFAALLPRYPEDEYTNLIDLIADAMHWCDQNGEDFDEVRRIAAMHFEAEVAGDE
jgi:hypothetical protein